MLLGDPPRRLDYIERRYNPRRRYSALGYHSPIDYERITTATADAA